MKWRIAHSEGMSTFNPEAVIARISGFGIEVYFVHSNALLLMRGLRRLLIQIQLRYCHFLLGINKL